MFGSSNRTIIQTQTSKINTKMVHWQQNQASAMTIPDLWHEPCRKWVRWTKEKKHRCESEESGEILEEEMVSDLLSGVL